MFQINQESYGVRIKFDGFLQANHMEEWVQESKKVLPKLKKDFGVLIDMRTMKPLPVEASAVLVQGQQVYKESGMKRSVVIFANPTVTMQAHRLAKETGILEYERYIDASKCAGWEQAAIEWLNKGTDPNA